MRFQLPLLLLCVLASCVAPPGPPAEVGTRIISLVDEGKADAASKLFVRVSDKKKYRQRIYPVLFDAAQRRYEQGDTASSTPLLRFLVKHYERSVATRQALLYALFIQRSGQNKPDSKLLDEIDGLLDQLRDRLDAPPVWLSLVRTQQRIDRGKLDAARESMAAFRKEWDGEPKSLTIYVEDIERYLNSH